MMAYYNTGDIAAAAGVLQHARQGIDHHQQQLQSRTGGGMDSGASGVGGSSSRLHYSGIHHQSSGGSTVSSPTSALPPPATPSLAYGRPCTSNSSFHGYAPSAASTGRGLPDPGFDHLDPANGDIYLPLHHAFSQLPGCGGLSGLTSPSLALASPGAAVSATGFRDYLSPTASASNAASYSAASAGAASSSSGVGDFCNDMSGSLQCSSTPVYPWMTVVGKFILFRIIYTYYQRIKSAIPVQRECKLLYLLP